MQARLRFLDYPSRPFASGKGRWKKASKVEGQLAGRRPTSKSPPWRLSVVDATLATFVASEGLMESAWNSHAPPASYSLSAKGMHWFVAAAVIVLLALGPVMKRLVPEGSLRDNLYTFHEALGALVLIVMVVRLLRRLAFGVPAPDASMPLVEQQASLWAQYALYVLLFVTMVLGWAGTNAYGDPVSLFGLFNFPAILGKDQPLSDRIFVWHLVCGIVIGAIVALHVAGAIYHWLIKRDRVLQRMT